MLTSSQNQIHEKALQLSKDLKRLEKDFIEILNEVEVQKIHLKLGYASLWDYAIKALQLSEQNAYAFVRVSRKSREVPELKQEIEAGRLTVSKAVRIVKVLTPANQKDWIQKAVSLPKAALERAVVEALPPEERKKETVRRTSAEDFRVSLNISEKLLQMLKRAQDLESSRKKKNLSLEETLEELLEDFLKRKDPIKKQAEKTPTEKNLLESNDGSLETFPIPVCPGIRADRESLSVLSQTHPVFFTPHTIAAPRKMISKKIRRSLFQNSEHQCQFTVDSQRCGSKRFLQIHHLQPVSKHGNNAMQNLQVLCSSHHSLLHSDDPRNSLKHRR